MEIGRLLYYIFINCVVIIPYLAAKPFSLNEAIAAESQQRRNLDETLHIQTPETTAERFSLNKVLSPLKSKRIKTSESIIARSKKISPLKYKKKIQIKSPLRPKKLKYAQKLRRKRKNNSLKRNIDGNDRFNRKYMPLLKNLGMLFDNLVPDTSDSRERQRKTDRRNRYNSEDQNSHECKCGQKSDSENAESKPPKKAVTSPTSLTEISIDNEPAQAKSSFAATVDTSPRHIGSFRQDKNVSLLLTRNTPGPRGNHNGFSERSGPAFHSSIERDISWDHRNGEYITRHTENGYSAGNNEDHPRSTPRDDAGSDGPGRRVDGIGSDARSPIYRRANDTAEFPQVKNYFGRTRGIIDELKRENKLETRRDEAKGATYVPKSVRKFRGYIPEDTVGDITESIQSEDNREESVYSVAHNNASHKRIIDRSGTLTEEDKKNSSTNEVLISDNYLSKPNLLVESKPKINKGPFVTIIDGYSVARDKNGRNKLAEKSIRFHSEKM